MTKPALSQLGSINQPIFIDPDPWFSMAFACCNIFGPFMSSYPFLVIFAVPFAFLAILGI